MDTKEFTKQVRKERLWRKYGGEKGWEQKKKELSKERRNLFKRKGIKDIIVTNVGYKTVNGHKKVIQENKYVYD